jgi:hypothetical protein
MAYMSTATNDLLATITNDPQAALSGTDLQFTLPLTRTLLNEVLAARPRNTPISELYIDPDAGNRFRIHLSANAPVVGSVSRRITFVPGPAVHLPGQPWLQFAITDGLKFFDKPLINVLRGQIEARLPKGIELSSSLLRIHVPALITKAGYRNLLPLIKNIQLRSEANRLVLTGHLNA